MSKKKLPLVAILLLSLTEFAVCTTRQRIAFFDLEARDEDEQRELEMGVEAGGSIPSHDKVEATNGEHKVLVGDYPEAFPEAASALKEMPKVKTLSPPIAAEEDQSTTERRMSKKPKLLKKPKVTESTRKSVKSESKKEGKRTKREKGKRSKKSSNGTDSPVSISVPTSSEPVPSIPAPQTAPTNPPMAPTSATSKPTRTPPTPDASKGTSSPGQLPPTPPEKCDPLVDLCCRDLDCDGTQICRSRSCLNLGNPRFTLTWHGSEDKDILVRTPEGIDIYYDNIFDSSSGGQLQYDVSPEEIEEIGSHAENVYFPIDGSAPKGVYEYFVFGGGDEPWNVTVALNDEIVDHVSGAVGDAFYTYQFGDLVPTVSPIPMPAPSAFTPYPTFICSTTEHECCVSNDCIIGDQSCANRNCVDNGTPRFTLTWIGAGDIDLYVRTPGGERISFDNLFDPESGGILEEDVVPVGFGHYAENIYFPESEGLRGTYLYGVSGSSQEWDLSIYLGDELVERRSGKGLSADFAFNYGSSCDRGENELGCCTDLDCNEIHGSDGSHVCANQNCVTEGALRFSLLWEGTNDKDLLVITPDGAVISYESLFDEQTGGTLEEDTTPIEFAHYVESVYFPIDRALVPGTYGYQVSSRGFEVWTVEVYLDGALVDTGSGMATTELYTFEVP